jgi:hypothetical protein
MPMYCESLRAGIFTCLKIIPKIWLVYTVTFSRDVNEVCNLENSLLMPLSALISLPLSTGILIRFNWEINSICKHTVFVASLSVYFSTLNLDGIYFSEMLVNFCHMTWNLGHIVA